MSNDIAVIIVNYNTEKYLTSCVESVLADDPNVKIIVVDNHSTDNSIALLEQKFPDFKNLVIIKNNKNLGFSVANNIGINACTERFILLLNPDCLIKKNTLRVIYSVMQEHNQAGMIGCLIRNPDGTIQTTAVRSMPTPWNTLVRVLHLNKFVSHHSFQGLDICNLEKLQKISEVEAISGAFMFVRREALQQVGLLDENYFLYCEDVDWMMRFRLHGWQILFVPQAEIIHIKSLSSRKYPFRVLWYKHTGMVRFYKKFLFRHHTKWLSFVVYIGIFMRFIFLILLTTGKQLFNQGLRSWQKSS